MNTIERRQKEHLARRNSILKAAREVFFSKGFINATVDEIAERCSLAKGTIYLYFKSKEEMYVSLMVEGMTLLRKEFEKIAAPNKDDNEPIEKALQSYYGFYKKNKKYFRIMFLSSQPDVKERVSDELLKACVDVSRDCLMIVSGLVQQGIEREFYKKVNPWVTANILWSMVSGIIMSYDQDPIYRDEIAELTLEEILQEALNLTLEGLRVKS